MFSNLGLHIMQFPSKRWGYVGSIPTALGSEQPATSGDVLGNRAHCRKWLARIERDNPEVLPAVYRPFGNPCQPN